MSAFTCLSCHVAYQTAEGQREHFRSDWHRYNLMRKVADLPPVSEQTFKDRALQAETQIAQLAQSKDEKKKYCRPCGKSFANQMSFDNHMLSKKHNEKVAVFTEESNNRKNLALQENQQMAVDGDDFEEHNEEARFYCKVCSCSLDNQVSYYNHMKCKQHMEKVAVLDGPNKSKKGSKTASHSSKFVDEDSDDSSEYEEVEWEGDAIELKDCLFCSHHSASLKKKLEHMSIEHSFFIPDLEYCSDVAGLITHLGEKIGCGYECIACNWIGNRCPTLDAVQKHMKDKGHCYLNIDGDKLLEFEDYYDYSSTYPDAGQGTSRDDEVVMNILSGDDFQLVLPSGAVVGHRTLMKYYRQRLKPERTVAIQKTPGRSFTNLLSQYRALGWNGATQADVVKKSKDLKFMQKIRSHHNMRLGVKANKLQHHFRQQNPV
ncbi:cytoplasmic 60S subunit biogenesis factor ZNF622 isoform X2 [Palaemon carinicauda]|uniref:cytoplasmic 60S subunit biogenesis factor ZNF622 isoform X2 n=1 Tax=Palaemon carinicauda TaxID=392227 RepID=UPI0035B583D3